MEAKFDPLIDTVFEFDKLITLINSLTSKSVSYRDIKKLVKIYDTSLLFEKEPPGVWWKLLKSGKIVRRTVKIAISLC